ncbi:transglutaminase domain-containing protein [Psychroserpens ponticola]|uniref:Transglutaminase domain-containing protein n=1 Tax=Psychroserpens ponticola TaxID=2932268 RepID=A0ABY7S2W4_9FLAO|nr:transglutaminase domain-containing protein [Psychroserpens ponticola]WCO03687.1 transglutaminase domain-containing protein [Psychroserpens ponticola]
MKTLGLLFSIFIALQANAQLSDFDHIDFKKADSIALVYKGDDLKNLPELSHNLTSNLDSDVERFRAIYIWVCTNVANDYGLYLKNKKKREKFEDDSLKLEAWNESFKKKLFSKLRKRKKTICSGYAYLVSELSRLANINCRMVNGFGRTSTTSIDNFNAPNHSWNAVKLDNKWYLSDPTWASGIVHPFNYGFKFNYNNGLFLTSPEFFALTHYPIESKWMFLDNEIPTFQSFLENPILYGKAYKHLSAHLTPNTLNNTIQKNETITFKYELIEPIDKEQISFIIDNGYNTITTKPKSVVIDDLSLTLEYQFNKTGYYDTHFLIGENLIVTYTFKVED